MESGSTRVAMRLSIRVDFAIQHTSLHDYCDAFILPKTNLTIVLGLTCVILPSDDFSISCAKAKQDLFWWSISVVRDAEWLSQLEREVMRWSRLARGLGMILRPEFTRPNHLQHRPLPFKGLL